MDMMGLVRAFKAVVFGETETLETRPTCRHETDNIRPTQDHSIWYTVDERRTGESWHETDAAFIRVEGIETDYVCLGCGEEKTILTSKRLEGEENIQMKEGMNVDSFREENAVVGGFYNGFPEDYPWANVAEDDSRLA